MNQHCKIFVTTYDEGQVLAGIITITDGALETKPKLGYEEIFDTIIESAAGQDPKKFLQSLPTKYNGSMMRAELSLSADEAGTLRKVINKV
jgi:hypothetical protein